MTGTTRTFRHRRQRWPVAIPVIALAILASACGGNAESAGSDRAAGSTSEINEPPPVAQGAALCALLTPNVQERIDDGMTAVLAGAELQSTEPDGVTCVQRFVAGDGWIELSYEAAPDDSLSPINDTLSTDGLQRSRAALANRSVDVVATTSDPAGISAWDASLVGAGALAARP